MTASALAALRRKAKRRAVHLEADPVRGWRPLPKQWSFLASSHRRRLLRAGNQIGKTTAGAVDLLAHVTGRNPWTGEDMPGFVKVGRRGMRLANPGEPAGIEAWVICASWSQSVEIQRKIFELVNPADLHPETVFDDVRGFRGKNPAFRIRHASGGWSLVRIKTMAQGGLRLASATIQYAWFDEPPGSPRIFSEITKRVMRAGKYGRVVMTMTPVNADVEWIRKDVEGENGPPTIEDHHARMEAQEFCPMVKTVGGWVPGAVPLVLADGTPLDEPWILAQIADTLPHEVEVVCHGGWRMSADQPVFPLFRTSGPDAHVSEAKPPRVSVDLLVGVDHGVRTHTQVAILVALLRGTGPDDEDSVWVLDEYVGEIETTETEDADGILSLLDRRSIRWAELDEVNGDRAHAGQGRGPSVAGKSNEKLAKAIAKHRNARKHGIRAELHPPISRAKRGISNRGGSVEWGCTWIHRAMVRGRFHVHPRCTTLIKSIQAYDGTPNSPESHAIDALRYSLRPAIWRYESRGQRLFVGV